MFSLYYSGGASNASPALSLGGAKSVFPVTRRIFGPIPQVQFQTGVTLYRCVYVQTSVDAVILPWFTSETPSSFTTVAVGWGSAAIGETEPVIASETAPPGNVLFSSPAHPASASSGGAFLAGQYRALWLRYVLNPTQPIAFEAFTLTLSTAEVYETGGLDFSEPLNTQYMGPF